MNFTGMINKGSYGIPAMVFLLLFSIVLVALQHFAFNKSVVIEPYSDGSFYFMAAESEIGGSQYSATIIEDSLVLDCNIVDIHDYYNCEVLIEIASFDEGPIPKGVDFSDFDRVGIWLDMEKSKSSNVRLSIRHFDEAYSSPTDYGSMKYNNLSWSPSINPDMPLWFELSKFQVPNWWLEQNEIGIEHMGVDVSNVISITISSGERQRLGKQTVALQRIAFHGKIISKEELYGWIIALWLIAGTSYLLRRYLAYQTQIALFRDREAELASMNRLLDVKNKRLAESLNKDEMTGILNRKGLNSLLFANDDELRQLSRLTVGYIDIDHFKRINDTAGHGFGDVILKEFARLLSENIRDSEFLARWGGEEFIVACPNLSLDKTKWLTDKLRRIVQNHSWPNGFEVTCSIGIAEREKDEPIDSLLMRADEALYRAKEAGRNKVLVA